MSFHFFNEIFYIHTKFADFRCRPILKKKRVFKQNLFTVAPFAPWYLLNSYQVYALISDLEHDSQTIKET